MEKKLEWNKKAIENIIKDLGDRIELCGQLVESAIINNINDFGIVDTGRYKNSITHVTDLKELSTKIGTNVEYSPYLEFGTVKMAPRPAIRLGLYESEKKIIEILTK